MDNPTHKFCVSWFNVRVANVGTSMAVRSWNEHPIPSKLTIHYILLLQSCVFQFLSQRRGYQMF